MMMKKFRNLFPTKRDKTKQWGASIESAFANFSEGLAEVAQIITDAIPADYAVTPADIAKLEAGALDRLRFDLASKLGEAGVSAGPALTIIELAEPMFRRELHAHLLARVPIAQMETIGHG